MVLKLTQISFFPCVHASLWPLFNAWYRQVTCGNTARTKCPSEACWLTRRYHFTGYWRTDSPGQVAKGFTDKGYRKGRARSHLGTWQDHRGDGTRSERWVPFTKQKLEGRGGHSRWRNDMESVQRQTSNIMYISKGEEIHPFGWSTKLV